MRLLVLKIVPLLLQPIQGSLIQHGDIPILVDPDLPPLDAPQMRPSHVTSSLRFGFALALVDAAAAQSL